MAKPKAKKRDVSRQQPETLATRLTGLIQQGYGGNVARAASAIGIERTTLMRIAGGLTDNPHIGVLRKVAEHFHVNAGWLLTGEAPAVRDAPLGNERWNRLVKSLDLPADVAVALRGLPATTFRGTAAMVKEIDGNAGSVAVFGAFGYLAEANTWSDVLGAAIQNYGTEKVGAWFVKRYKDVLAIRNAFTLPT